MWLLLLPSALAWLAGSASALDFHVDIDAPKPFRQLIEAHLDLLQWRGDPTLTAPQLTALYQGAQDEIAEIMATEGYYSPRIDSTLQEAGERWHMVFHVVPGEPTRVEGVDIELSGPVRSTPEGAERLQQLRREWPLKPGSVFRQPDWEAGKRLLLQTLTAQRYPAAALTGSEARVDPGTRSAHLRLALDSGPPVVFGELRIQGLSRYPESVVRDLSAIRPGMPYSQAQLLELQARLQESGYFSGTEVRAEVDPEHPQTIPVQVTVIERPSRKLAFGLGYSTNTGARGQVDYQDFDFLDRAWRMTDRLRLEQRRQNVESLVELPTKPGGYRDAFGAKLERTELNGETTRKLGMSARRARTHGRNEIATTLLYQTERRELVGSPEDRRSNALTLNESWTRRSVDDLIAPTRGYLVNVQLGGASQALLSDRSFVRAYGKWTRFYPVGRAGTLRLFLEGGAVASKGRVGIPSDFLFRAGGDQSVRGYAYQSLGVPEAGAIVGGRYLGVASAEYVHRITSTWGAAVFIDAGNATDNLKDFKAARGYGVGVRYRSPVGPLSLDVAYGEEVQRWRVHFSVGFVF